MPPLKGSGLRDPETLNWWLNRVTLQPPLRILVLSLLGQHDNISTTLLKASIFIAY